MNFINFTNHFLSGKWCVDRRRKKTQRWNENNYVCLMKFFAYFSSSCFLPHRWLHKPKWFSLEISNILFSHSARSENFAGFASRRCRALRKERERFRLTAFRDANSLGWMSILFNYRLRWIHISINQIQMCWQYAMRMEKRDFLSTSRAIIIFIFHPECQTWCEGWVSDGFVCASRRKSQLTWEVFRKLKTRKNWDISY